MIPIAPFLLRQMRKRGVEMSLERAAARSWVVEGPTVTTHRPPIYDPADLEKVTAPAPGSTMAYQLDRLTRPTTEHPAVRAHLLRDVSLVDGWLLKWNLSEFLCDAPVPSHWRRPPTEIRQATLASSYLGVKFFGHWLLDDAPLALLGRGMGVPVGYLAAGTALTPHQQDYARLLEPAVRHEAQAHFSELVVFDYVTESADKAERYEMLKARLRHGAPPRRNPGVMLLRKTSGQRRVLVNEMAIAERMAARGLTVIDPLEHDVPLLVEACLDAEVLIGCEGSHLAHAFLPMRAEGAVCVLQPPFKFDNFWRDRTNAVGGVYASLIGDAVADGFEVDADRVERMLDRLPALPTSAAWPGAPAEVATEAPQGAPPDQALSTASPSA